MKWIILLFLLLTSSQQLEAQLLTQQFRFQSGVFLSYEEFQNNQPSYKGDAIKATYFQNPQTEEVKVEYIRLLVDGTYLSLDSIWGISLKGIPYVRVDLQKTAKTLRTFAKMEVRGNICYYFYNDKEVKNLSFSAYNPVTRRPYRTGFVQREIPVLKEKMLRFKTGEVRDFTYQHLLEWIATEEDLVTALTSLGPNNANKSLFKTLLLYDDRYEVRIGQ